MAVHSVPYLLLHRSHRLYVFCGEFTAKTLAFKLSSACLPLAIKRQSPRHWRWSGRIVRRVCSCQREHRRPRYRGGQISSVKSDHLAHLRAGDRLTRFVQLPHRRKSIGFATTLFALHRLGEGVRSFWLPKEGVYRLPLPIEMTLIIYTTGWCWVQAQQTQA